jgi:hypothetical protein
MQLLDKIEARRFVGREFLLWLWFESELFEGTLSTEKHGTFGLWLERKIVLSIGKEVTQIKGAYPASHREAKEALARGKLPELAGIHISLNDNDSTFIFKADQMALMGLSLTTALEDEGEELNASLAPSPKRKGKAAARSESDMAHEAFYDRMQRAKDLEELLEALYVDFLALRLSAAWEKTVFPRMTHWASEDSEETNAEPYRKARNTALKRKA